MTDIPETIREIDIELSALGQVLCLPEKYTESEIKKAEERRGLLKLRRVILLERKKEEEELKKDKSYQDRLVINSFTTAEVARQILLDLRCIRNDIAVLRKQVEFNGSSLLPTTH